VSFPRYPEYKDSGVEWLGEVPAHWELLPLFSCARERIESNRGMVENNLLSLSYGRIITKNMFSNDGLLPESFETYQVIRTGDVVFRLTDLQNDKRSLRTALVEETGIITFAYVAVSPIDIDPPLFSYLMRAYDLTKVFYSMGGGLRQSMKFSDLKRLPVLIPPLPEQRAIAGFLDRETAKIDALVAEQERLCELLREKRQAVISHAVTKGLDPDAPMKDSWMKGSRSFSVTTLGEANFI
jgi:type I restriction enzyme S subunit